MYEYFDWKRDMYHLPAWWPKSSKDRVEFPRTEATDGCNYHVGSRNRTYVLYRNNSALNHRTISSALHLHFWDKVAHPDLKLIMAKVGLELQISSNWELQAFTSLPCLCSVRASNLQAWELSHMPALRCLTSDIWVLDLPHLSLWTNSLLFFSCCDPWLITATEGWLTSTETAKATFLSALFSLLKKLHTKTLCKCEHPGLPDSQAVTFIACVNACKSQLWALLRLSQRY